MINRAILLLFGCIVLGAVAPSVAQRATGFDNPYYTSATEVAPSTLVPSVRKWYYPQRLYELYDWRQEEYSNYARNPYQRYNNVFLEGSPFYDLYGNYISQGWQIYDWTEDFPTESGSDIFKSPRFRSWFSNVLISSSNSGQFHSSLMVGDGIRTTLTPLTFSKPLFDGAQWDMMSDKYALTLLTSRINNAGVVAKVEGEAGVRFSTFTNMVAARGQANIGDFSKMGFTFVNAAHMNSNIPFGDNSLKGQLSGPMNNDFVRLIIVRISDDSPEDGEGGALLARWRIFADGVEHTEDIVPVVEGGVRRRGVIEASGTDVITLTFNLEDFTPVAEDEIDDFREIKDVEIGLVLANDYKVEVASNKQTNQLGAPVFLTVMRAPGNVKDGANQAFHRFRYGLPTGNRLLGFDLSINGVAGIDVKGEYVRNYQYRRFPNENFINDQTLATNNAEAFYVTAQKRTYPWTLFGEVFSMDTDYSTRAFIPNSEGEVFYDNEQQSIFEFVDDNDDQDELPDWTRRYLGPRVNTRQGIGLLTDSAVFPGLDENNDDLSDFNRNFNRLPDYDEPFLRMEVDSPDFLFGVDMNNNGVIDRFEDDNEADYPYKRGHRGYNTYVGVEITPGVHAMAGHLDERLLDTDRENTTSYLLLTATKKIPRHKLRLRLISNPRKVADDIPEDVFLWTETPGTRGGSRFVRDPLAARDAFVNTTYMDLHYDRAVSFSTKIKHELYSQLGSTGDLLRNQRFLGMVNKAKYPLELRSWDLILNWKQLYSNKVPADRAAAKSEHLTEIVSLLAGRDITRNMSLMTGVEYEIANNLRDATEGLSQGSVEDGTVLILAAQVANNSAYQGYALTTNVGVQWTRENLESAPSSTRLSTFITVFAGLGTDR